MWARAERQQRRLDNWRAAVGHPTRSALAAGEWPANIHSHQHPPPIPPQSAVRMGPPHFPPPGVGHPPGGGQIDLLTLPPEGCDASGRTPQLNLQSICQGIAPPPPVPTVTERNPLATWGLSPSPPFLDLVEAPPGNVEGWLPRPPPAVPGRAGWREE